MPFEALSPRPLSVVHLVLSLETGGLEKVVVGLAEATDRSRVQSRVVCLEGPGALAPGLEALGVPVEALHTSNRVWAALKLARRLRVLRPDVLHTHNLKPHLVGVLARSLSQVPVLVHTKHGRNEPHTWRSILYSRLASAASQAIVPVSADAAAVVRDIERVRPERVVVIRNGIGVREFDEASVAAAAGETAHAVCVARLGAVKDHATLLKAARRVVDAEPSFVVSLVGDGPERETLEGLVRSLGLQAHVRFAGPLSDVRPELARAQMFLLSSTSEGISMAVLEAMASGLPVVATDVGGNKELVVAGETGLLVPPRAPEALADAVVSLLRDRERMLEMGRRARGRVEELFDMRRTAERYERLYRGLLAGAWPHQLEL